jgi:RNA polymerase sigma-70 factor (ECF subfamily)
MKTGEHVETERSTGATPADADLVRTTLGGRREAFGQLIERYQRRATSVAYRLLGDLHDALEVCQESFVRAFRKLDSLEDPDRFGPWLLRIVTNMALNFRRSRGPRLSFTDCLVDADEPHAERGPDCLRSADPPGSRLAGEELRAQIQAGMARLSPQQRAALVLFSIEQLPQKDVACILNCSVEAVKWHVFQGRKKMKEFLADYL